MKLLGHNSPEMTMVYLDIALTDLQREFHLARLLERFQCGPALQQVAHQRRIHLLEPAQHLWKIHLQPVGEPVALAGLLIHQLDARKHAGEAGLMTSPQPPPRRAHCLDPLIHLSQPVLALLAGQQVLVDGRGVVF